MAVWRKRVKRLYGWVSHAKRTPAMRRAHEDARNAMPAFAIIGKTDESPAKIDLTTTWDRPAVKKALGFAFPGVRQVSGSCVGAAGGNAAATANFLEILKKMELERIVIPFWLLPYGRSRLYAGMRSPGDGSMGSTFAEAAKKDGFLDARMQGLPSFTNSNGLTWGESAEYSWSDGDASQTMNLLPESRLHPFETVSPLSNADDVEQAVRNQETVTVACSLIPRPRIEDDGEAYGEPVSGGGHQTTILGVWIHPTKGRLFKYVNQWGRDWGKDGACYISDRGMNRMIQDGEECYAFSAYRGHPAQPPDILLAPPKQRRRKAL